MTDISGQFTLLLVDDNPINLTLLVKIVELDLPQVRVLTAANALDGLLLADQEQIDGAFIDVQMPQMSGLEMCRKLKANPRTAGMPLVLITAHQASPEMRAEGLEVGAYDFISQPISNIEMLARIKVMLRLCHGERLMRRDERSPTQQLEDPSIHLRWLNGLFLSGDGQAAIPDQQFLKELAVDWAVADEIDEQQLVEQLVRKFPLSWRRTFSRLALLDNIPLSLAGKLSEINDIEAVFDYLQRHGLVLLPRNVGEEMLNFKPQVRELLREKLDQTLDLEKQQQTFLMAADWYQQKNDLATALDCLLQAEQYPAVSQLFSQTGLALLAECYQPDVEQLIGQIPEEEAVRCGWMALFTGVSYMRVKPLEVDNWLELARARFSAASDQRGELLTLSQQIIQYLVADGQVELGQLRLARLNQLAEQQIELLSPYNRLKVFFAQGLAELFYAGSLSSCEEILARAMAEALREKLIEQQLDLHLLQVLLALFQGRFRVARAAVEQGRLAASKLAGRSFSGKAFWIVACELLFCSGELDSFYQQRRFTRQVWGQEELQKSSLGPLLNWFAALGRMAQGNMPAAAEQLEMTQVESPAASRPHLHSWILQLRGLIYAHAGQYDLALTDAEKSLELREQIDKGPASLPNLLLAGATSVLSGRYESAAKILQDGLKRSSALKEERYRGGFHAWLALQYIRSGEETHARQQLKLLFDQLRRQQVDFFFGLTPELIRNLVPLASTCPDWSVPLQQHTQRWLACNVAADGQLIPTARLQVLGGFQFQLQGKSFDLSEVGQTSRQILALLAVAPNLSLSTELLMATLWPESPPSRARNSFDTALSRLRKALEATFGKQIRQDYLVLEKGMLILRNLRIDASEFSISLEQARRHLQRQNLWQAELAFWQAERIWSGEFLAGYELEADLPYRRDQFNQLRLEKLEGLARLLFLRGDSGEAERLLQSGLQLDPTHDVLVQQLLDIYQLQGDKRATRQLLENYRKALQVEDYDPDEIAELIASMDLQRLEL
jgi:DNA-binding response OmpR family regulator/Flp pilus assembly protein TadD